jgi:hypothetical protein
MANFSLLNPKTFEHIVVHMIDWSTDSLQQLLFEMQHVRSHKHDLTSLWKCWFPYDILNKQTWGDLYMLCVAMAHSTKFCIIAHPIANPN